MPAVSRRALVALAGILSDGDRPAHPGIYARGEAPGEGPEPLFHLASPRRSLPAMERSLSGAVKDRPENPRPGPVQKALKEAFQLTVQGNRATELRRSGPRLGIVVQNDTASFRTDIVVQNLSESRRGRPRSSSTRTISSPTWPVRTSRLFSGFRRRKAGPSSLRARAFATP